MYLIEGIFEDIGRYAGATADWVITIAHLICDPSDAGQLYTHTTGTVSDWYHLDKTSSWRQVVWGDPLLPGIYEFEPMNPVLISRISVRNTQSVTTKDSKSSAATFARHIKQRDGGRCVVSGVPNSLIASRLIPKRMGSDGAREVVTRFSGAQTALGIHRFDPRIGILLNGNLDELVDHYELGFYHVTGNTYTLHNFYADDPGLSYVGLSGLDDAALDPLHLRSITLSNHDGGVSLPPKGVFDWHYLQCIIHTFGTPQYKNFPGINFYVHPFKTSFDDDSDDEYADNDDNEVEPPYPSYRFDRFLREQGKRQMAIERHEEVERWSSGLPSGIEGSSRVSIDTSAVYP